MGIVPTWISSKYSRGRELLANSANNGRSQVTQQEQWRDGGGGGGLGGRSYFVIHFLDSFSTSLLPINQNNSKIPASVTYTSGHVSYTTNIITQTLCLVQQHNIITLNSSFRIAE